MISLIFPRHFNPVACDLEFRIGRPQNASWSDSEDRWQEAGVKAQVFGMVLGIRWGTFIKTISFGGEQSILSPNYRPHLVLHFPFIFPFLSMSAGNKGFYIGAKDYGYLPVYRENGVWPDGTMFDRTLTFSARWSRSRTP